MLLCFRYLIVWAYFFGLAVLALILFLEPAEPIQPLGSALPEGFQGGPLNAGFLVGENANFVSPVFHQRVQDYLWRQNH